MFIDKKTGETVESGGCEDEYRFMVGTHPVLGSMLPITMNYICDVSFVLFTIETNLEGLEAFNLSVIESYVPKGGYLTFMKR